MPKTCLPLGLFPCAPELCSEEGLRPPQHYEIKYFLTNLTANWSIKKDERELCYNVYHGRVLLNDSRKHEMRTECTPPGT